jgi:hypothetical protein
MDQHLPCFKFPLLSCRAHAMTFTNLVKSQEALARCGDVTRSALVIVQTGIIELCLTNGY